MSGVVAARDLHPAMDPEVAEALDTLTRTVRMLTVGEGNQYGLIEQVRSAGSLSIGQGNGSLPSEKIPLDAGSFYMMQRITSLASGKMQQATGRPARRTVEPEYAFAIWLDWVTLHAVAGSAELAWINEEIVSLRALVTEIGVLFTPVRRKEIRRSCLNCGIERNASGSRVLSSPLGTGVTSVSCSECQATWTGEESIAEAFGAPLGWQAEAIRLEIEQMDRLAEEVRVEQLREELDAA